jgi:hypothetical protein
LRVASLLSSSWRASAGFAPSGCPDALVTSSLMPVIFILMFTYVFGAVQAALPAAAAGRCVNWLIPGLLAQFALFGGAAFGMADDLASGIIGRSSRCR